MPEFITGQLHDVIFALLADDQLSIREHAIKTFSSYLSRCEFQVSIEMSVNLTQCGTSPQILSTNILQILGIPISILPLSHTA